MNEKPIIEVQNLTKEYLISKAVRENTLRDKIMRILKKLAKPNKKSFQNSETTFKALDGVSFNVFKGAKVGIIGKNGSGKSTLLKIMSRITWPTQGRIILRGQVSSLLEVGTGFHTELTGQENIYLNGAILGMRKKQVDRKFNDIVNFAGFKEFLNTPIKRYSSGMAVRLGFSIAAHLDTEILVIDEVLAVGDAEFKQKCLIKMEQLHKEGRTILFVSHDMGLIKSFCNQCVWLESGKIKKQGTNVSKIVKEYLKTTKD